MIELGANILLSYMALVITTYLLRSRLKNVLVYAIFWYTLYSIPCAYYTISLKNPAFLAPPAFSTVVLLFIYLHKVYRSSSMVIVLIPLPQVVALMYLVMVYRP